MKRNRFTTAIQFAGKLLPSDYYDGKTPGLALRVQKSGHRSWSYLYRYRGRLRRWTIGRYEKFTLKQVREKVKQSGDDPAGEKREDRTTVTFGKLSAQFLEEHAKVHNRRWKSTQTTLDKYILPKWKHFPVKDVTRRDVKLLLSQMPGKVFPNRVRALLSKMFTFAICEDLREYNPVVAIPQLPETRRERVLSDAEIRHVWETKNPVLQLILATCQRPEDVRGIRRSEISGNIWTIPAERFKTKTAHAVPLTPQVMKLLNATPQLDDCDRFFTDRECKGSIAMLKNAGVPDARPKDLQRTARSRLSAIGVSPDIAERVQGHALPGIRRVYDKHDYINEKRDALTRWSKEIRRILMAS